MAKVAWFLLLLLAIQHSDAQTCVNTLSGKVIDKALGHPLLLSTVYVEESGQGEVVDSLGNFVVKDLCPGDYHLIVSHIACENQRIFITIRRDTSITVLMNHHHELLDEVVVHGSQEESSSYSSRTVDHQTVSRQVHKDLSRILESIEGVSVLKTGVGISKPIVHGLYGNRISVLNNGVEQAGQQWGNDHAPEIDPNVADHLSVIKGANALEYGSNPSGAIILVEPPEISEDPHLHGIFNYLFSSNGKGHNANLQLEQNSKYIPWKLITTFKRAGDHHTPDYFLTNTGRKENNIALLTQKKFNDKFSVSMYYSLFDADIGILRGSHIGNLTDLEEAIGRDEPFFTNDEFSYQIDAPKQSVTHHLLKLEAKYFLSNSQSINIVYGGQINNRKEFDVRRSGRSDLPALSIRQITNWLSIKYNNQLSEHSFLKSGLDIKLEDNTNDPETGILPLIPDYRAWKPGLFAILQNRKEKWSWEVGARIDHISQLVLNITNDVPRMVERINQDFTKVGLNVGVQYDPNSSTSFKLSTGYSLRAPEINELYSFGLHQGVSGIEEGNRDLEFERSLKWILSYSQKIGDKGQFNILGYFHPINNYIFLEPQAEYQLTIRGAFPSFKYNQTDARLVGADVSAAYELGRNVRLNLKYALVRGTDRINDSPLVYIPPDNLEATLSLFGERKTILSSYVNLSSRYVFKQQRFDPEKDFLEPPDAYFLLNINAGTELKIAKQIVMFSIGLENMLDHVYRDYLNRTRYFADEMGRNLNLRIKTNF